MKELSIEEKAKAYDKVLKWIHDLYSNLGIDIKEKAESIFPESYESEDERIRTGLINGFNECLKNSPYPKNAQKYWHNIKIEDIFSWLEKQGEPIEVNPTEFDLRLNRLLKQFESLPKEELASSLNFYLNVVQNNCTYKQKPTNIIEPKFKVGDWIIYDKYDEKDIDKIVKFDNDKVIFESGEWLYIDQLNEDCKLWTVQDAKDGDVLMSRSPFIYGKQCPYGGLDWYNNNFIKASNFIFTDSPVHPATKEQRDILFQKMKEAGYEWDAERKELNKIHIIDEGKAEMDYCFTKMMNGEKVSSTLNKEDEKIRQTIINEFEQCSEWYCSNGLTKEDCINWLNKQE